MIKNQNFFRVLYSAMWHYGRGFRWAIALSTTLIGVGSIIFQMSPYILGRIFTQLQNVVTHTSSDLQSIYWGLLFYVGAMVVSWVLHGPGRIIERYFAFRVREACLNDLYGKMQSLPLDWHQNQHSGSVTDRIRNAALALHTFVESQYRIVVSVVNTIIPLLFLWHTSSVLALICLVGGLIAVTGILFLDRKLVPILEQKRNLGHALAALLVDYIANIQSIITLRLGRQTKQELAQRIAAEKPAYFAEAKWNEWKWAFMDVLMAVIQASAVGYMVYCVKQGTIRDLGLIVAAFQYLQSFAGVFYGLTTQYEQLVRQGNDFRSSQLITEAWDACHTVVEHPTEMMHFKTLSINDMSFAYQKQQLQGQVENITLDMHMGQKIAFVGASGSGKSTVMKLLRGLYAIEQGTIALDGKDVPWSVLGGMTTLIPQEPEIFENTVRYNITMGVTHDEADILAACKIACFDDVLDQLPQGLDTDMREKGVNLSGGQKQRLALARGVFAAEDSAIILLDEPTSSIDGLTEREIYKNLFAKFAGKIIIGSIHRLHLLNEFDKIYVFDQGRISQNGTLDELLAHEGLFKTLWRAYQNSQEPTP